MLPGWRGAVALTGAIVRPAEPLSFAGIEPAAGMRLALRKSDVLAVRFGGLCTRASGRRRFLFVVATTAGHRPRERSTERGHRQAVEISAVEFWMIHRDGSCDCTGRAFDARQKPGDVRPPLAFIAVK